MRTRLTILLLLTGLALQPALAGGWGRQEPRREPPRPQQFRAPPPPPQRPQNFGPPPGRPVSRDDAARRAQQMSGGGRVLAADPAEGGYRVRVLKNGEVRSVYVPGQ
jgi:hypothetical protein